MPSLEGIEGPDSRSGRPSQPAPGGKANTRWRARARNAEAKLIKSRAAKGKARVTFTVDPRAGAQTAAVCGEWNDWSADADVMRRDAEGGFSLTVDLDAGRAYRFRYLLDGQRWDNDWSADAYVPNGFGGDDSIVDLTALAKAVPSAARKTPTKKEAAKTKKEAGKNAAAAQTAKKAAAPAAKPARPRTK
jgi:1,4-alpha-glucan branching enzyme